MKSDDYARALLDCANADPLLPRSNPSAAFWQEPVHPTVSSIQSESLPKTADIVVIGSGITACSVTKALLESPSLAGQRVIVLEARTLTSGATGRNGGHLVSAAGHDFPDFEDAFGTEKACEVAKFSLTCVERVKEVVATFDDELKQACELRELTTILGLEDEGAIEHAKNGLERFEAALPEFKGYYTLIEDKKAVQQEYGFRKATAVIVGKGAALWPYRLITGIFSRLLDKYSDRLTIETMTPVTDVSHNSASDTPFAYTVMTTRGSIQASQVIYCTNGHTGHLLPRLRGKIFPLRGTMSTQKAGPSFPNLGASRSWSTLSSPSLDLATGVFSTGLIYITQNAATGDVFIGGERQTCDQLLVSDDSIVPPIPSQNLATILPEIFEGWDETEPEVKRIWSGVMGFTADTVPMAGNLTEGMTGRVGTGEWLAAGFNGYGMDKCWLTGEALVGLITGDKGAVRLPRPNELTDERLSQGMERNFWIDTITQLATKL